MRSHKTEIGKIKNECPFYSYSEFAIDTKDEWYAWIEKYHSNIPISKHKSTILKFEEVQIALYKLVTKNDEGSFTIRSYDDLSHHLEGLLSKSDYESCSLQDLKNFYDFYKKKLNVFNAHKEERFWEDAWSSCVSHLSRIQAKVRKHEQELDSADKDFRLLAAKVASVAVGSLSVAVADITTGLAMTVGTATLIGSANHERVFKQFTKTEEGRDPTVAQRLVGAVAGAGIVTAQSAFYAVGRIVSRTDAWTRWSNAQQKLTEEREKEAIMKAKQGAAYAKYCAAQTLLKKAQRMDDTGALYDSASEPERNLKKIRTH